MGLSQNSIYISDRFVIKKYMIPDDAEYSYRAQSYAAKAVPRHVENPKYLLKSPMNKQMIIFNTINNDALINISNKQLMIINSILNRLSLSLSYFKWRDIREIIKLYISRIKDKDSLLFQFALYTNKVTQSKLKGANWTFAHGDLHINNILDDNGTLKIIDFDLAGIYPEHFDLIVLILRITKFSNEKSFNKMKKRMEIVGISINYFKLIANFYISKIIIEKFYYFEITNNPDILYGTDNIYEWYDKLQAINNTSI